MSVLPFIIEYEPPRPRRVLGQHIGLGMAPQEYMSFLGSPPAKPYTMPWRRPQAAERDVKSTIKMEKNEFQVTLNVKHFSPNDLSVKTVEGFLVVEAKHEEREDEHGCVSRSFTRKYTLPEGVDADMVSPRLSYDGILSITVPLKEPKDSNEKTFPIILTGPIKKEGEEE